MLTFAGTPAQVEPELSDALEGYAAIQVVFAGTDWERQELLRLNHTRR